MTFLDRIKETSTSTGTGTFTLGGAVLGYKVFTNGTYKYCIVNETESEWEVGEGTVTSGVLTRTTIEASSNGGAAVSFSAGTKYVFNTVSAAYVNSLVPYTGATAAVNLGAYGLTSDYLQLSTTPTASGAVGRTLWNDQIGSTETTLKGGSVVLKNGVDLVARVVNKVTPAATLTKATYKAVRVSGAQGQRLAIAYAQANNDNNSADTIGIVCETIAANQEGFIITVGQLSGINTTGSLQGETWADGDVLYLSPTTAGNLTNIKPTGATGHIVVIGYVEYSHAINGSIYVKIMNGWELDELHNVYINAVANNDVLVYESSSTLWKNKPIATILGYTPADDSLVVHLAGAENITGVKTFQNALQTTTGNNLLNTGGGNTVIGYTADPASSYKLDVNGTSRFVGTLYPINGNVIYGDTINPIHLIIKGSWSTSVGKGVSIGALNQDISGASSTAPVIIGSQNTHLATSMAGVIIGVQNQNNETTSSYPVIIGTSNTVPISGLASASPIIIGNNNSFVAYTNAQIAAINIGNNNTVIANTYRGGILIGSGIKLYGHNQLVFGNNSENVDFGIKEVYFGNGVRNEYSSVNSNSGNGINVLVTISGAHNSADKSGGNFTLAGGKGTGTGTPGKFIVQTSTATTTGATLQTLSNRLEIDGTGQLKLNGYTSTSVFTGTVAGLLGFDSSGNVITSASGVTGSGTAGQVTYWSGTSAVTGSSNLFWDNVNGRLGIGTSSPGASLDVNGIISSTVSAVGNMINLTGTSNVTFNVKTRATPAGSAEMTLQTNPSATSGSGAYIISKGYQESWFYVTSLQANVNNKNWRFGNSGTGNYFAIQKVDDANLNILATSLLIFSSNGNVLLQGTGTSTSDGGQRLQVIGSMRVGTTAASAMYWDDTNARLIIGNTSGTARLDVGASTTSASALRIRSGTAPTSPNDGDIWYDGTNIYIRVGTTTKTFTII